MSFLRGDEIYRSDVATLVWVRFENRTRSHLSDEFPVGYSWANALQQGPPPLGPTETIVRYCDCSGRGTRQTETGVSTSCLTLGGQSIQT